MRHFEFELTLTVPRRYLPILPHSVLVGVVRVDRCQVERVSGTGWEQIRKAPRAKDYFRAEGTKNQFFNLCRVKSLYFCIRGFSASYYFGHQRVNNQTAKELEPRGVLHMGEGRRRGSKCGGLCLVFWSCPWPCVALPAWFFAPPISITSHFSRNEMRCSIALFSTSTLCILFYAQTPFGPLKNSAPMGVPYCPKSLSPTN